MHDEEHIIGAKAMAVPVFNIDGIVGGINLVAYNGMESINELKRRYSPPLIRTGREISESLGHLMKDRVNISK